MTANFDLPWKAGKGERLAAQGLLAIIASGVGDELTPAPGPLTYRMRRFYQTYQGMWGARKLLCEEKRRWFKPAATLPDLLDPLIEAHRGIAAIYHVNQQEQLSEDQLIQRWPDLWTMLGAAETDIGQLSTTLRAGLQG